MRANGSCEGQQSKDKVGVRSYVVVWGGRDETGVNYDGVNTCELAKNAEVDTHESSSEFAVVVSFRTFTDSLLQGFDLSL